MKQTPDAHNLVTDYGMTFAAQTTPAEIAAAVEELWGLRHEDIFAGTCTEWDEYEGPVPVVLILSEWREPGAFGTEFTAGSRFAEICGHRSELEVATALCVHLGTRALMTAPGRYAGRMEVLVTEDGWHGGALSVDYEDDEEYQSTDHELPPPLTIEAALHPVPLAPEIPVLDQRILLGWIAEGIDLGAPIPNAGWLDPRPAIPASKADT